MRPSPARTQSRSVLCDHVPARGVRRRLALPLVETLRDRFRREGFRRASLRAAIGLDLRYRGQSFELEIPDEADPIAEFHRRHEARFGFADPQRTVELIAVRVRVVAEAPEVRLPRLRGRARVAPEPVERLRPVFERGARIPVFDRERLLPAAEIHGPAVVADRTGTTFVAAGDRATVHPTGALLVQVAPRNSGGHP